MGKDGRQDQETKVISSNICIYMKAGDFSSRPGLMESRLQKVGYRHSRDNIFHINASPQDEKLYVNKTHACLSNIFP